VFPRPILISAVLLAFVGPARPRQETVHALPPLLYTVAKSYEPLAWLKGEDRFSPDAAIFVHEAGTERRLVPDFSASADPEISFDGQRVLFSGKAHAQDPWQIWEIALTGGEPKRVTSFPEDCIRSFYLPEDRVVYARRVGGRFVIEAKELESGKTLVLTYIPGNALPTDVLRDGRILFEAAYPLGSDGQPEVYTVYSDGSGVESYRCDHGPARHGGRQSSSGDIVFASARGLSRFTSSRALEISVPAPEGEYAGDIAETASGDWIVSRGSNPQSAFRLMRWTPGSGQLEPLFPAQDASMVQPVLLAVRPVPNRHPSGLHDWPGANLLCLNAYTSRYAFAAGSIHSVRLYTRDDAGKARLLGTAPVERDGSFFVHAPTEEPLQIELLDAAGKTLKRESGFFWMRRGEQRGCVGCHAGPETAPENAVPMILLKSTTPADMSGAARQNAAGGQ